jgi:hypothetical protein
MARAMQNVLALSPLVHQSFASFLQGTIGELSP